MKNLSKEELLSRLEAINRSNAIIYFDLSASESRIEVEDLVQNLRYYIEKHIIYRNFRESKNLFLSNQ